MARVWKQGPSGTESSGWDGLWTWHWGAAGWNTASEGLEVVWPDGVVGIEQLWVLQEFNTLQHHRHVAWR